MCARKAARNGHEEAAQLLLEHYVTLDAVDEKVENSCIMIPMTKMVRNRNIINPLQVIDSLFQKGQHGAPLGSTGAASGVSEATARCGSPAVGQQ